VQFTATLMPGLPWEIRPLEPAIELHPGELRTTRFLVRNLSDQTIVGQAVPSVTPGGAHFRKLDCFCFTQQTLAPGESREMALTFIIDGDIGDEISELTLAYAFFPAENRDLPA
jgi:cytochrome c oxidase assembly protein subunit 11